MAFGYRGKILHVDLTNRRIEVEEKDDAFYRTYLGGRGIGYYYLLKEAPPLIDPFSPQNILVLATGVMTGSPIAASCRFSAIGKSPLTGTAGESEAAGFFGPSLKSAGFDAIVFRGRADIPVYLWVTGGRAEIRDASHLTKEGAKEVQGSIREELKNPNIRVAQTGLAGMNLVRFSNITNNLGHFNGRNGFGAVMGSKNLRAVAAFGTERIPFADSEFLKQTAIEYAKTFQDHPLGKQLFVYGTTAFCEILSELGALPVNNFRRSKLDDPTPLSGDTYNDTLLQERKGCYACPIRCKRGIAFEDPKYKVDPGYGGPEYETMAAFGSNLNILDLKAIAKCNEICNRYCMDTISAGMVIAFACECFEKGILSRADTGGMELCFGDADLVIKLLEMIARREGVGNLLAEGMTRLARRWGVTDQPYHLAVKGQELPMHDPRVKVGVGFGYAISTYGADHMYAPHDSLFTDENSMPFKSLKPLGLCKAMHATDITAEKVRTYSILDNLWKMMDALGLCVFGFAPRGVMPLEQMVQCLNAITGWDTSLSELMKAGERGTIMAKAFNSREGFTIQDDRLPGRLFAPKPDGPNAGENIFNEQDFNRAIEMIYSITGCDPAKGRPNRSKLTELGLEWVEEFLNK